MQLTRNPTQIADVKVLVVLVTGTAVPVEYISPRADQHPIPEPAARPRATHVYNSAGKHTVKVLLAPAVPSVFSLDASGTGPAAAINGVTGQTLGAATPLHTGDYASI